jgi:hypothetical protein
MFNRKKQRTIVINTLLAVVVSLIINFSYLLAVRQNDYMYLADDPYQTLHSGTLHMSKDGYGYIVCGRHTNGATGMDSLVGTAPASNSLATGSGAPESLAAIDSLTADNPAADTLARSCLAADSIYVSWRDVSRLRLRDGDHMTVIPRPSRQDGGNPMLAVVKEVNGLPFDYRAVYNRPADNKLFALQFGYFFLVALALLFIMTIGARRDTSWRFFLKRGGVAVVVAVALYFVMPVMRIRTEEFLPVFLNTRLSGALVVDPVAILKCSFVLVLTLFYGRTYQIIHQRESVVLENERLKNENLAARYNTLVSQINPHFLFNSLNSLSALVREGKNDDAVKYIDRLSDAFRYAIRVEPQTTTTLGEELDFVAAYKYLLEVRYDKKLFIDIDIDPGLLDRKLPAFSIQPLVENAVKHNTITRATPLRISIRAEGDRLVVSNPVNPKIEPENGTGIGLANLAKRWLLLTGREIEITNDGRTFLVSLPFLTMDNG